MSDKTEYRWDLDFIYRWIDAQRATSKPDPATCGCGFTIHYTDIFPKQDRHGRMSLHRAKRNSGYRPGRRAPRHAEAAQGTCRNDRVVDMAMIKFLLPCNRISRLGMVLYSFAHTQKVRAAETRHA